VPATMLMAIVTRDDLKRRWPHGASGRKVTGGRSNIEVIFCAAGVLRATPEPESPSFR
jgi:hypothetical protein